MNYDCEKFIDSYIESFNRTSKSQDEKRGLALPKMEDIETLEEELMSLFFPGLSGSESKSKLISVVTYHMESVTRLLYDSVLLALSYEDKGSTPVRALEDKSAEIVDDLASHFKDIRALLKLDAEAGFKGDPAAKSVHEVILSYPSIQALAVHRVAHHLYKLGVPLVPRMMNEVMHHYTGIDIHPGAEIGESFFIDHGTGVVIGETTFGKGVMQDVLPWDGGAIHFTSARYKTPGGNDINETGITPDITVTPPQMSDEELTDYYDFINEHYEDMVAWIDENPAYSIDNIEAFTALWQDEISFDPYYLRLMIRNQYIVSMNWEDRPIADPVYDIVLAAAVDYLDSL